MAKRDNGSVSAPSAAKQALVEVKRMRARLDEAERARTEPIAVCGTGMRFPGGVDGVESYWHLLSEGIDAITEVPASRWDIEKYYDPDPSVPGKMYCRHGGFLDGVEDFDAEFFGLSPREALYTDPQQRMLLEVSWEALEQAAIAPGSLARSRSGVFIGMGNSDYGRLLIEDMEQIDAHTGTGGAIAAAAGRLSYALGLNGPSTIVDTACSSSLTALAFACESLRKKECDLALAGGSSLILTPEYNIAFSKARMLAADGRCKTFDARADGYVRGEGCAIIVLKRLSDALANDDPVLAVVRGFAVNQDGASSGLTVPNGPAQEAVIQEALDSGGIRATDIDYVEAHGTATSLGDPIEVHALGAVFSKRTKEQPLLIGSVKTNFGHLEAAAGIASVIKVILSLQQRKIPATLHFKEPSQQIDWSRCPVKVATELTPWPDNNGARIAGISSFGFSGTNAHVVLEEAPERDLDSAAEAPGSRLLTLSARAPAALRDLASRYAAECRREGSASLDEIVWTANTGRSHLSHRLAVIADNKEQLAEHLAVFAKSGSNDACHYGEWFDSAAPSVAFLFSGDGSQCAEMGRFCYEQYPAFRAAMDECDRLLRPHIDCSLVEKLYQDDGDAAWTGVPSFAQPALFALQYSQARLLRAWGVEPAAVFGHGLGEYAAACVAGVFDVESGLALAAARGRLYGGAESLILAEASADAATVRSMFAASGQKLFVAAENGPQSTVVAGGAEEITALAQRLRDNGIETRELGEAPLLAPGSGPAYKAMQKTASEIEYALPHTPVVLGRFGRFADKEITVASAWVPDSVAGVQFGQAMNCLHKDGTSVFVEVGPQSVLLPIARKIVADERVAWVPVSDCAHSQNAGVLENAARLYAAGVVPDWRALVAEPPRRRVALPSYPFQRDRFWWRDEHGRAAADVLSRRWPRVVEAGQLQAGLVPIDMDIGTYTDKWQRLADLANAYIVDAWRSLGLFAKAGESHTACSLVDSGAIKPVYKMLMSRWLDYLAAAGLLTKDGDNYVSERPLQDPGTAALLEATGESLRDIPELLNYVRRCGTMLVDVLLDRESALQTLFPGGATETAQFLYRDWSVPQYFNGIAAAVVERFVSSLPAGRSAKLVEIGAGTGATTASVLPRLESHDVSYFFTDVSDYFLSQASESFAAYDFVHYGLLDIGKDPQEQGYGKHGFDVVIAANVLHATSNLEDTVDQVLSLLAPGGIMVLFETTGAPHWSDITVSLIEGWQSFADSLRTDSPLLNAGQWSQLLHDRGFDDVVELPGPGSPAEVFGSHIIVAHVADDRAVATAAADVTAVSAFQPDTATGGQGSQNVDPEAVQRFRQELDDVADNERVDLLVDFVRSGVNRVLRRDADRELDRRQRLMDLGVDSLMAVELRNDLTVRLGLEEPLPATLIFDYPTVEAVAAFLDTQLSAADPAEISAEPQPEPEQQAMSEEDVAALSDDEVKAALRARLGEG